MGGSARRLLGAKAGTYVGAIDQGTQSSRFVIYSWSGEQGLQVVANATEPVRMRHPEVGWAEQDPWELLSSCQKAIEKATAQLPSGAALSCVGITNQRESTVAWDSQTAEPLYPGSLVWLDARTRSLVQTLVGTIAGGDPDAFRSRCGLPLSTYFRYVFVCLFDFFLFILLLVIFVHFFVCAVLSK
ncbi:MAG: FGGY family carbohydrate kinase [archaeon]|nr:FGGY family carbohydrate kinase [archaeon]